MVWYGMGVKEGMSPKEVKSAVVVPLVAGGGLLLKKELSSMVNEWPLRFDAGGDKPVRPPEKVKSGVDDVPKPRDSNKFKSFGEPVLLVNCGVLELGRAAPLLGREEGRPCSSRGDWAVEEASLVVGPAMLASEEEPV